MIILSGYRILSKISESTYSTVYRAIRESDQKPVVLKLINKPYSSDLPLAQCKKAYELVCILNAMNVKGVVRVYEIRQYLGSYVAVLEDFGGQSLRTGLLRQKPSVEKFLPIAINLSDILAQLHSARVVHRNINPGNIVFNPETRELKLIDFSLAISLDDSESQSKELQSQKGDLLYISPEMTGKMKWPVDHRTDFYSLGVTFYEMLSGGTPFPLTDPMGLIHCHLARAPVPLHEVAENVPKPLSDIIMKLLAKSPEERYQNGISLKMDLQRCLTQLQVHGHIVELPFETIHPEKLHIPDKLYDREQKIASLMEAWEDVKRGIKKIVTITGEVGSGKSSLVKKTATLFKEQGAFFIEGKFSFQTRDIPYSAFIQALHSLACQMLMESQSQVKAWKEKLAEELGSSLPLLAHLVPIFRPFLDAHSPVAEISHDEAVGRLYHFFHNFIKAIASKSRPLVMFLDDLQWADKSSMALFSNLSFESHFLLIVAYRSGKKEYPHAFLDLPKLREEKISIHAISLGSLRQEALACLVADTFLCDLFPARELSLSIYQKTYGNPFFVRKFLEILYQEKEVRFEIEKGVWTWDIVKIGARSVTGNVAKLMVETVGKLPDDLSGVIEMASCIGYEFDLQTLSVALEKSAEEVRPLLEELVEKSFVVLSEPDGRYSFSHDRIHEAVYAVIPKDKKQAFHRRIGKTLWEHGGKSPTKENMFQIVHHLNIAQESLSPQEKEELARMNLVAAQNAFSSSAYHEALGYFSRGIDSLPENAWKNDYELCFTLYKGKAECEHISSNDEKAEQIFEVILQNAGNNMDRARVYGTKIKLYNAQNKMREALVCGRKALGLLGMKWPEKLYIFSLLWEFAKIKWLLRKNDFEALLQLPDMKKEEKIELMNILFACGNPAFVLRETRFFALISLIMVRLSLQYGNAMSSSYAYIIYAYILGLGRGENHPRESMTCADIAFRVNEKFHNVELKPTLLYIYACCIGCWFVPYQKCLESFREGYKAGHESGKTSWRSYCAALIPITRVIQGDNLSEIQEEGTLFLDSIVQTKNRLSRNVLLPYLQMALCFSGKTRRADSLDSDDFEEKSFLEGLSSEEGMSRVALCQCKMEIFYFLEKYDEAYAMAERIEKEKKHVQGLIFEQELEFYSCLVFGARYETVPSKARKKIMAKWKRKIKRIKSWAEECPANFMARCWLAEAEMARIVGNPMKAIELYAQSISRSERDGFKHVEALGNELFGKFWLSKGQMEFAQIHIRKAYQGYTNWGASAKAFHLKNKYPSFFIKTQKSSLEETKVLSAFEMDGILKAFSILERETSTEKILSNLLEICTQQVGAQWGFLVLQSSGNLYVQNYGEKKTEGISCLLEKSKRVCTEIVHYVASTQDPILLDDAVNEGIFTDIPYIRENRVRSVLCVPLIERQCLLGSLYFENNLVSGAFVFENLLGFNMVVSYMSNAIEKSRLAHVVTKQKEKIEEMEQTLYLEIAGRQKAETELIQYRAHLEALVVKRTEALRQNEERYRLIFEHSPLGIVHFDQQGAITGCNPVFAQIMGISVDKLIASKLADILQRVSAKEAIKKTMEEGMGYFEGTYLCGKKEIVLKATCKRINSMEGKFLAGIAIIEDITEKNKLETRLRQAHKMEAIGTLAGGIAHDFNNILEVIVGYTELVYDELAEGDASKEDLLEIRAAAFHARDLVKQILSFSRQSEQKHLPLNVSPIVKETLKLIRASISTNIEINSEIRSQTDTIMADPTQIHQVVINLCTNAAQSMKKKGGILLMTLDNVLLEKEMAAYPELMPGKYLQLRIQDTGDGIEEKILDRIFDPYFTTKAIDGGTGMGLTIVKGIVKSHGGAISVESEPGVGTTFTILFPCIETEFVSITQEVEISPGGDERILLVDDNQALVEMKKQMLERLGYRVETRISSLEALEVFDSSPEKFDLVITDMSMPQMTGARLSQEILRLRPDMPIILCTGFSDMISEKKAKAMGIKEFLIKPVDRQQFASSVRKVLDNAKRSRKSDD